MATGIATYLARLNFFGNCVEDYKKQSDGGDCQNKKPMLCRRMYFIIKINSYIFLNKKQA